MSLDDEHAVETYRSLVTLATEALRALPLLNGGAVVTLLAYLGQVSNRAEVAPLVSKPLILFILGLVLATAAHFGAYFTQLARWNNTVGAEQNGWQERSWLTVVMILAFSSLGFFAWGALAAVGVFSRATGH